ncbi:hypothetical protein GIB67_029712 [Kingdonia uniflora]|uniref:Oberon PHD finger domain-containing protein n=1 Tax=Kingdonia uniflora TaxID=39325 RepID=A0A7J7LLQ4_9MAGN|nr:hypothetical protein GIB67_029712 [Kingdonia uniflora]
MAFSLDSCRKMEFLSLNRKKMLNSFYHGYVHDHAKCNQLSLKAKRELLREIAPWPESAHEILCSWTLQELHEIINAELEVISENSESDNTQSSTKRQKKNPNYIPLQNRGDTLLCRNLACRANLSTQDFFCKRCSCCICYLYDDNKDPSLWLTCGSDESDPPNQQDSCGLSCHLRCALKHERAGIMESKVCTKLDGSFYCVSCGKVNELMGSCRRQMLVAKDTRRVDILCYRIFLSRKILRGTEHYQILHRIVNKAAKELIKEFGPLDRVSTEMGRGIVIRLACVAEVQKLCTSAIEAIDSMFSGTSPRHVDLKEQLSCKIRFEEASPISLVMVLAYEDKLLEQFLGCRIWHRSSNMAYYPENPTCIVLRPEERFFISDLDPSTKYFFKVSIFSIVRELGVWESQFVTKALIADENSQRDSTNSSNNHSNLQLLKDMSRTVKTLPAMLSPYGNSLRDSTNSSNEHSNLQLFEDFSKNMKILPEIVSPHVSPTTPPKSKVFQEVPSSVSKKESVDRKYESVEVIKWLQREGYMEMEFSLKFLFWFSSRATMRERRVVNAFVDTLIDDPHSLAGQLVDTFTDEICSENKRTPKLEKLKNEKDVLIVKLDIYEKEKHIVVGKLKLIETDLEKLKLDLTFTKQKLEVFLHEAKNMEKMLSMSKNGTNKRKLGFDEQNAKATIPQITRFVKVTPVPSLPKQSVTNAPHRQTKQHFVFHVFYCQACGRKGHLAPYCKYVPIFHSMNDLHLERGKPYRSYAQSFSKYFNGFRNLTQATEE